VLLRTTILLSVLVVMCACGESIAISDEQTAFRLSDSM
jgi:hypothetical protein